MRMITGLSIACLLVATARAERMTVELEWGFGPEGSEMYWDGQVRLIEGRLMSIEAITFEADRHDRLTPPKFQSFTMGAGTDGLRLVVDGDDRTAVRFESRQGEFQWTLGELREKGEASFPSKEKGRLIVRLLESLAGGATLLSDRNTQDSDPALCRLSDGRQLVLWRAFLGTPARDASATGGDQIRGRILDRDGKPGEIFDILPKPGDMEVIVALPADNGNCRVVWSEQREANWDLYTATVKPTADAATCSAPVRLTEDPGVDKAPSAATLADGSAVLVWQGWRGTRSLALLTRFENGQWREPIPLGDEEANAWNPVVATAADGSVAVAWFCWQNGSYDVCLRVWEGGRWGPVQLVAATDRLESLPSLAYDGEGTLWVAYEQGRANWGMDSNTAGLRSERNVQLRCYRDRRIEAPRGTAALALGEKFRDRGEMAHLATDGKGALWLFFRSLRGAGIWDIYGTSLADDGWTRPLKLEQSPGGQNVRTATAPDADGRLRVAWTSDHRVAQFGLDSFVYTSRLPSRPRRTQTLEAEAVELADAQPASTRRAPRPEYRHNEKTLGLYFGDLHRHTELSVCRTGGDGSLEDGYRYAIDAAKLDFLCLTDHVQHVKILNDYDFWRSGKTADLNRVPGLHLPFYGYERSQRFPYGHRNIIGLDRNVKRVPRTADNRAWSANSGYEGEVRLPPPELWKRLLGENVVTIPHTSTSPVMGTDFAHAPAPMEPAVEIYQGCRYTTEYAGAPDPRQTRDDNPYGGKAQPAGYIWNALSQGHRYGFIASSDHSATHNSYTCVWAEDFSNRTIQQAIALRRCYAATEKIVCRMHMGPHAMGSEFAAPTVPPLDVDIEGTTAIERVDVIKDNNIVYSRVPEDSTPRVTFQFQDVQPDPGVHYYYARVIQKDRNMAWISPIWVNVGAK